MLGVDHLRLDESFDSRGVSRTAGVTPTLNSGGTATFTIVVGVTGRRIKVLGATFSADVDNTCDIMVQDTFNTDLISLQMRLQSEIVLPMSAYGWLTLEAGRGLRLRQRAAVNCIIGYTVEYVLV